MHNGGVIEGELGGFLRARREAVRPEDVGLPRGERRRTPGLRRAELATLAGVSVEYLTRLEQGRDRRPSLQIVAAIADALRLSRDDRLHLHVLLGMSQGTELLCHGAGARHLTVPDGMTQLLARLEPSPAAVLGPGTELLAWTEGFERLARPLGMLDGDAPDLLRWAFADPRSRETVPEWDALADALVTWVHHYSSPRTLELVEELTGVAGDAFAARWAQRPTGPLDVGLRSVRHPDVGPIRLSPQVLSAEDRLALVVLLPRDAAADAALDRLAGVFPGSLRRTGT